VASAVVSSSPVTLLAAVVVVEFLTVVITDGAVGVGVAHDRRTTKYRKGPLWDHNFRKLGCAVPPWHSSYFICKLKYSNIKNE